jgi:predicted GNAT family N-acyltransferase
LWDAFETKYGVSDAGSELHVMEQFCDYKMVDDRSIVEQAHEIQSIEKKNSKASNACCPTSLWPGALLSSYHLL